jgi:hypothetical protein
MCHSTNGKEKKKGEKKKKKKKKIQTQNTKKISPEEFGKQQAHKQL